MTTKNQRWAQFRYYYYYEIVHEVHTICKIEKKKNLELTQIVTHTLN